MLRTAALLFALLNGNAIAEDSISFRSGVGVNHSKDSGIYSINYEQSVLRSFHYRFDLGMWGGSRFENSFFTSFLLGGKIGNYNDVHFILDLGVMAIANPDNKIISGAFQFTEEVAIGYDKFELGYKHISNASIKRPNIGRDYIFFNYRVQL